MNNKSSKSVTAVLRAAVLPALGLSLSTLMASACERQSASTTPATGTAQETIGEQNQGENNARAPLHVPRPGVMAVVADVPNSPTDAAVDPNSPDVVAWEIMNGIRPAPGGIGPLNTGTSGPNTMRPPGVRVAPRPPGVRATSTPPGVPVRPAPGPPLQQLPPGLKRTVESTDESANTEQISEQKPTRRAAQGTGGKPVPGIAGARVRR